MYSDPRFPRIMQILGQSQFLKDPLVLLVKDGQIEDMRPVSFLADNGFKPPPFKHNDQVVLKRPDQAVAPSTKPGGIIDGEFLKGKRILDMTHLAYTYTGELSQGEGSWLSAFESFGNIFYDADQFSRPARNNQFGVDFSENKSHLKHPAGSHSM